MNFYFLVLEQSDGFKFPVRGTLCSSLDEIKTTYNSYKKELYESVQIKEVSISVEEVLTLLVCRPADIQKEIMSRKDVFQYGA